MNPSRWRTRAALPILVLFALSCAGPQGPAGPAGPAGPGGVAGPAGPAGLVATTTREFQIQLGEGEVIREVERAGKTVHEEVGEFHRWEPSVLVVFAGDTVRITAANPRKHIHSFGIAAFNVDSGPLEPRVGKKTVEFKAERPGVYRFDCTTDFNEAKGECDPDHKSMTGQLVVLAR